MARSRSGRGIGFFILVVVLAYAVVSGGVALTTGRKCGDLGRQREWRLVPPGWECKPGPFVVN